MKATDESGQIGVVAISTSMIQKSNGSFELPLVFQDRKIITINGNYNSFSIIAMIFVKIKRKNILSKV